MCEAAAILQSPQHGYRYLECEMWSLRLVEGRSYLLLIRTESSRVGGLARSQRLVESLPIVRIPVLQGREDLAVCQYSIDAGRIT